MVGTGKPVPVWFVSKYTFVLLLGLILSFQARAGSVVPDRAAARADYQRAMQELRTGMGPRYRALREDLATYPLVIYLDYEALRGRLHDLQPAEANDFLVSAAGSPLADRFYRAYLGHKGRDRNWREFLGVAEQPPADADLACYYYRALRATGAKQAAWQGARAMWNSGKSQDDACDILFERWLSEGPGPDDALVWSRALKAFDARSSNIIRYVQRFASPGLLPLLEELYAVYRRPDTLIGKSYRPSARHAQLLTVGIRRLAKVNPEQARRALRNASASQPFSDQQLEAMESLIARHSLFAQSAAPEAWLIETLARLKDDELTQIYLRGQVLEGDWQAVQESLTWLSEAARGEDRWRYWSARASEALDQAEPANAGFRVLARSRSFHGFLAAQRLDLPYQLSAAAPPPQTPFSDPGVARVEELLALGRDDDARTEWRTMIARLAPKQRLSAAQLAESRGWAYFTIYGANAAKAWNQVGLRFPTAFSDVFSAHAEAASVAATELMAIARRESAMDPLARSPVGALGLMQVMPSTGKIVARKVGVSWRSSRLQTVDYNVAIGARYYRSLLDRFDGHRVKALAGYNAGPHRVDRWVEKTLPTDRWIEGLPFRETREYVQNVLAYNVIYDQRAGRPPVLLREHEFTVQP